MIAGLTSEDAVASVHDRPKRAAVSAAGWEARLCGSVAWELLLRAGLAVETAVPTWTGTGW